MTSTWATGNRSKRSRLKTVRAGITRFISGTSKRVRNKGSKKNQRGASVNALIAVILGAMNPAFEESAMFENMVDLMLKDDYDVYVFDTAPTANVRRLLGMSKVYSLWVDKMASLARKRAASARC